MPHEQFLNESDDIKWMRDKLKGVDGLPLFKSYVLRGNEDCPDEVVLYKVKEPRHDDRPVATILFDGECEPYIEGGKDDYQALGGRKSNVEIVSQIMSYGNPMKQLVIMTALEKYPQMCIAAGASKFESGLLSGEAWIHACREILKELEEYRGQKVRRFYDR